MVKILVHENFPEFSLRALSIAEVVGSNLSMIFSSPCPFSFSMIHETRSLHQQVPQVLHPSWR